MQTIGNMIHGLRRSELLEVLDNSKFPVQHLTNPFARTTKGLSQPVIFDLDGLHITITPIVISKHDWDLAPADTIIIEVIIPPVDEIKLVNEDQLLRDSGIGFIQRVPAGITIRRTVTFVGGITVDNLLYQLQLLCVSALHLLGEESEESEKYQ
ncbi:hypothetical protein [Photorhabdus heterorhabditis]|uniref:Transfer repressor n=2 Tax=Photorhabdus heterorhabditis TaxID=880156 RepID=A0ABR5KEJ9_9GAMM|nr:hypothetical protein [Photorhabdus heterorhabditis]KOY62840.1 transfer repressor [Photorhabdus heterorhabditis]MBS9441215.1 transfer repressor [Photorhabdus heterorhabditis]